MGEIKGQVCTRNVGFILATLLMAGSHTLYGAESVATLAERVVADEILAATDIQGGLIVQLGCGNGKLTAALHAGNGYLVAGLETDAATVAQARQQIQSSGLYGPVSVEPWDGKCLPYVDNLVNLVVAEQPTAVAQEEILRVLAPNGVAYLKRNGQWTKTVKPRPQDIDEWTHYLHDPSNNAVAHDKVIGPPRHFQWIGSPRWARHHDHMASMSAAVAAGGRMFYIFDEGPTSSIMLPSKWSLIARNAFNGMILWKRPIDLWHPHLYPFKSGPAQLPRRLVALGDRVYATLGLDVPLTALDAATGRTIRTYQGTKGTEEVIASEGVLFLSVNRAPIDWSGFQNENNISDEKNRVATNWPWTGKDQHLMAVRAETGDLLWKKDGPLVPLTLAADARSVFFHDGERVICLDRQTGKETWRSQPVSRVSSLPTNFGPTLVVYGDVVLFAGGDRFMTALARATGKKLWDAPHHPGGHNSPEDVLVVGGLVWSGAITATKDSGVFTGRDLLSGVVKNEFQPDTPIYFMHHRCYRAKATDNYLLPSRTGIEFVDYQKNHWIIVSVVVGKISLRKASWAKTRLPRISKRRNFSLRKARMSASRSRLWLAMYASAVRARA